MACVGPTGFLIDESRKNILKDIDRLLLVIELKQGSPSNVKRVRYKKMNFHYVGKYAKTILEKASDLEVDHTDNKKTDKSFVLIKNILFLIQINSFL
jgi:hypothetical protein